VQRRQLGRIETQLLAAFTCCGRRGFFASISGTTGQIIDPAIDRIPILARQND